MTALAIGAAAILISLLSAPVLGAECEDCHTIDGASGGYVFERPTIVLAVNAVVPPGMDFPFEVIVRGGTDLLVEDMNATLTLSPPSGDLVMEASGSAGRARFDVPAQDEGAVPYSVSLTYGVFKEHATAGAADRATYREVLRGEIAVRYLTLTIDRGFLVLDSVGQASVINATADENAYDVRVDADPSIAAYVEVDGLPDRITAGESASFNVTLLHRGSAQGNITVSWYSNGSISSFPIRVSLVPESASSGTDAYHELGKYLGIASLALLLIGYFTGGTGASKRWANALFGNAGRRTRFHCAMSYQLLSLAIFHFAVLFYGPFSRLDQILVWQTVLGIVAMLIMIVIAVNGILQKRIVKLMGFANWKRIHAWGSYVATSLVIVHALTMGTHFLWFRDLFGM
jgi:hypothetical protein